MVDVRDTLDRLIREHGDDYASVSRMLGRNAAYVQQFIRRGVPRKLDEGDRRVLARYFAVDEALLGGPASAPLPRGKGDRLVRLPRLAVGASAGAGALPGNEAVEAVLAVDPAWLRRLTPNAGSVSMIAVEGDSMQPTLNDGDEILVDRADAANRLRDGIYVIRIDDALNVKRLAVSPASRTVSVLSDNPAYPSWPGLPLENVVLVGRVIWVGRKLA